MQDAVTTTSYLRSLPERESLCLVATAEEERARIPCPPADAPAEAAPVTTNTAAALTVMTGGG